MHVYLEDIKDVIFQKIAMISKVLVKYAMYSIMILYSV